MNIKKFLPLIAAAGLGLVALLIAHGGLGHSEAAKDKAVGTAHIIVAKESVAPGQKLSADNLSEQVLTQTDVPANAFVSANDVIGRVTVAPMVAGQPVLGTFLAPLGALPGLNALVPPGMRAITIDVNETTGVAGMIEPGSRVDLVSVLNNGEPNKATCRTVCSNVSVVAVGQRLSSNRAEGDNSVAHTVTLIAKPREAELIALACLSANTRLMLRGNGDQGPADSRGVVFTELLSGTPMTSPVPPLLAQGPVIAPTTQQSIASALPAPRSHTRQVELIEGSTISTVSFEMPTTTSTADPDDYTSPDTNFVIPNQK